MFNPPPVFANIIGSTQLGPCDDLRLLATPTSGQAAPMTWKWTLNNNQRLHNECILGSDEIPNNNEILYIPNYCLTDSSSESNIYYDIELNATNYYFENFNYLASTSTTVIKIVVKPQSITLPSIKLLTPNIINITNEQDLIIPVFVTVNEGDQCNDNIKNSLNLFSFQWSSLEYELHIRNMTVGESVNNPFGHFATNININNFVSMDLLPASNSSTLMIPSNQFEPGKYYGFKVSVTYKPNGVTNEEFVGVIVNLPIPYPKPSIMYQSIQEGTDIALDIHNFYDFYTQNPQSYGIEWQCFHANTNVSILFNEQKFNNEPIIIINESNANLDIGNTYNCSAHLFSIEENTFGMTWGRQESYFVFEYISSDLMAVIDRNDTNKLISVKLTTNIGTINRNKRIVISASFTDYYRNINTIANGLLFDDYTFEWNNLYENYNIFDNVYGISVIDHIDYEYGFTVNFVIDDEVNKFIFDGQKYSFELKVISSQLINGNIEYSGYGQIEFTANRGPNGGQCVVELFSNKTNIYRVECYGWTDEYMELPLEYNFMLLNQCETDLDCKNELVCDKEQSEYNVGICVLSTVGTVQNYLREWTNGNIHYFTVHCNENENYILRSFIRDYTGFVTMFDTQFSIQTNENSNEDGLLMEYFNELKYSYQQQSTSTFATYINAYDTLMDCKGGYDRTDITELIYLMYNKLINSNSNNLSDRFYDYSKMYSLMMDELFFDYNQFEATNLQTKTNKQNIARRNFAIINDMINYYNLQSDGGLNAKMIPRDLSVYELYSMTSAGNSAMQQSNLKTKRREFNKLKTLYNDHILSINSLGLNERLIDETHYNVSYKGLTILSGLETEQKLFSDNSDCGGDFIDIAPNYKQSYFDREDISYVKCELVAFNGGILNPIAISDSMSSPIIYWKLRGYKKDGTEVPINNNNHRRLIEFDKCSPFLYTIPHNPNTSLMSYSTRRINARRNPYVVWSVCKTILDLGYNNLTIDMNSDFDDVQAPNANDCYVLTHDENKTVCACNSNYTLLAVEEEIYYPKFIATLNRFNSEFTWTGLMESIGAVLWLLILFFLFTFAFYILPSYDKHKALLAVKKGLPKSQRENAYFQTAEGKIYRAAHININNLTFCQLYGEIYKIRLQNDHLCLWWMCNDAGSNISHFIKVLLTFFYCLLFMVQIAWFYGGEKETLFPDTLFAFLIAFETILPIWICAWCISKVKPYPLNDNEIDKLINEQMPIITKNHNWKDEYESDSEYKTDEQFDGIFVVPEIFNNSILYQEEKNNSNVLLRIYTNIDEEIEYLEENYMPKESEWNKKKLRAYDLKTVGYVSNDSTSGSSIESYDERLGFEGLIYNTHYNQARDAESLGFIPINDKEEYDMAASMMLHKNKNENVKQKRRKRLLSSGNKNKYEKIATQYDDEYYDNEYSQRKQNGPTISSMNAPKPMQIPLMAKKNNDNHNIEIELQPQTNNANARYVQKLLRRKDIINAVFAGIDGHENTNQTAQLGVLKDHPSLAPSQRVKQEFKSNINDEIWQQSNVFNTESKLETNYNITETNGINMDDIWNMTGAVPPELMMPLSDPFDAWKEKESKCIQKPLNDNDKQEYKNKLSKHFAKRKELLNRKYWLPHWCKYIIWTILICLIILFMALFLFEGNKLGAVFLWIPNELNDNNCTISVSEQMRFDYDFSFDESERRNPACSPLEINGSMPHCWDYRVRFTIASLITFCTSIILVQPLYIAILSLFVLLCLPAIGGKGKKQPLCITIRNKMCCKNKQFIGGTLLVSGDTNLEYGSLPMNDIHINDITTE